MVNSGVGINLRPSHGRSIGNDGTCRDLIEHLSETFCAAFGSEVCGAKIKF